MFFLGNGDDISVWGSLVVVWVLVWMVFRIFKWEIEGDRRVDYVEYGVISSGVGLGFDDFMVYRVYN